MPKIYQGAEAEYQIRQAPAGNWCVDVDRYATFTETYCHFAREIDAYMFIVDMEDGVRPERMAS